MQVGINDTFSNRHFCFLLALLWIHCEQISMLPSSLSSMVAVT